MLGESWLVPKVVLSDAANGKHLVQLGPDALDAQPYVHAGCDELAVAVFEGRRGALHRELHRTRNHL